MSKHLSLERILHTQGFGSRKACRVLIRHESVTVNGEPCDDPFAEFPLKNLVVTVDGERWDYQEHVYLVMNKPAHYECSQKTLFYPSIYTLLPNPLNTRGVQSIGRLDEDTTGLILLSDDGQFIHRMSSPKWKVHKVYKVHCKHPVSEEDIEQLHQGVLLKDETQPVKVIHAEKIDSQTLKMTLGEGKYHQVKRMIAAMGNRVEALQRIQIGKLNLPQDLPEGQWRYLTEDELTLLKPESSL
jgi:16S rRNA pseudouridine516 synthase